MSRRGSRTGLWAIAGTLAAAAALSWLLAGTGTAREADSPGGREAENQARCARNLERIGLALSRYNEANDRMPGNIVDKDGKPLLSWRVAILPHMGEEALYKRFKLDEPWDGPHNKPLLNKVPEVFHCPGRSRPDPSLTNYLGFEGQRTLFEERVKPEIRDALDEMAAAITLEVAEAEEGTPWTKPADLPFDENAPPSLYGAGSKHPGGFNALFANGSVRFLKATINPKLFRDFIREVPDDSP